MSNSLENGYSIEGFIYQHTVEVPDNFYSPKFEMGINSLDKELRVNWPGKNFIISKKDKKLNSFKNFKYKIKFL